MIGSGRTLAFLRVGVFVLVTAGLQSPASALPDQHPAIFREAAQAERNGDYLQAAELYRTGMQQGCMPCFMAYSYLQEHGLGMAGPDPVGAVATLKAASDLGYAPATGQLGAMYLEGWKHITPVPAQAIFYLRQAVTGGDRFAMLSIGRAYEKGIAVHQDTCAAQKWYRRALRRGLAQQARPALDRVTCTPADKKASGAKQQKVLIDPLTPIIGFTEDFADIYYRPQSDNAELVPELIKTAHNRHLIYTFEIARRLATIDPRRAQVWSFLAGMRLRYALNRCADKSLFEARILYVRTFIVNATGEFVKAQPPQYLTSIIEESVALFEQLPLDTDHTWLCRNGKLGVTNALPRELWPSCKQGVITGYLKVARSPGTFLSKSSPQASPRLLSRPQ